MEIWENIIGYEKLYEVSNLGNVHSVRRNLILKPQLNTTGYFQVPLTVNGKKKLFCIHKLVAEAFIPNPENKPQVNHIDGDKQNNHISNLEWVTHKENAQHAYDTGLNRALKKGTQHYLNKLSEDDVKEIRRLYETGMISQTSLAKQYGVNQTNIGFIVRREIWKHI